MWIKNISDRTTREECYYKGTYGLHDLKPGAVFEVNSDNFINSYSPTLYKQVDKERPRYYNEWILVIGASILSYIAGLLTK